MATTDRRERERAARRRLILTAARTLAEAEGWDAVTTRRLSTEIEYSQPVLYKHFAGMDEIAAAIAREGFGELADALRKARIRGEALTETARAYLDFAYDNPALYDAMFTRATTLRFAEGDTPPELAAAFAELRRAVEPVADDRDADALTEVLWAALHGLVSLGRAGRLQPGQQSQRLELLVERFDGGRRADR
ncbi:TetR/AcrR family transcriptional regulator [Mycobacterium sp. MYCO198283]|uniref:TetR/AcrR family transcriptional regulator n=1 Tax=Mycobacterium sp. MYCO198283 TaxID=2883505 RepID=UPI001E5887ED|nr:TetR/AcrR family transcriptional regulator [Mycobacterium sp. MYCO198283]MCG5434299.1 TetR/AcrR family transcriptional regulator [Mycobacterium sp. MYCO198283]